MQHQIWNCARGTIHQDRHTRGKCQCYKLHFSFLATLTCTYYINTFGRRLHSLSVIPLGDGIIWIATKNFLQQYGRAANDAVATDTGMKCKNDKRAPAVQSSSVGIHQASASAGGATQTVCCLTCGPAGEISGINGAVGRLLGHRVSPDLVVAKTSARIQEYLQCVERERERNIGFHV